MGSEEEYEVVIKEFEEVVKRRGVGEFNRGQRSLSACSSWPRLTSNSLSTINAQCRWKLDGATGKRAHQYQRACQLLCQGV
jgi:hypothetical protein